MTDHSPYGWGFFRAAGVTFGMDSLGSGAVQAWTSLDDLNWTQGGLLIGTAPGDSILARNVVWDGARYVASGGILHLAEPNTPVPAVWISTDAQVWTKIALPANLPKEGYWSVVYGHGAYVGAFGNVLWRSTDLTHWSTVQVVQPWSSDEGSLSVDFDGAAFVATATALGSGKSFAYSSSDGVTWKRTDLGGSILTIDARPSGFVAIVQLSNSAMAMGSEDGYTWTHLGSLPFIPSNCVARMLACIKPGGIWDGWIYSSDGLSWRDISWPAGLATGSGAWGPSPDPMFIVVATANGYDSAVYVIQPLP